MPTCATQVVRALPPERRRPRLQADRAAATAQPHGTGLPPCRSRTCACRTSARSQTRRRSNSSEGSTCWCQPFSHLHPPGAGQLSEWWAHAGWRQRRGQVQRARRSALCADAGRLPAQPQLGRAADSLAAWTVCGRAANPTAGLGRDHFHRGARQGRRDATAQAQRQAGHRVAGARRASSGAARGGGHAGRWAAKVAPSVASKHWPHCQLGGPTLAGSCNPAGQPLNAWLRAAAAM